MKNDLEHFLGKKLLPILMSIAAILTTSAICVFLIWLIVKMAKSL